MGCRSIVGFAPLGLVNSVQVPHMTSPMAQTCDPARRTPAQNTTLINFQGASAGIRAQADAYRDVRDNLSEGLRFYMSLQEAIVTLQQQIGDFCLTRRIQRCGMYQMSCSAGWDVAADRPAVCNRTYMCAALTSAASTEGCPVGCACDALPGAG